MKLVQITIDPAEVLVTDGRYGSFSVCSIQRLPALACHPGKTLPGWWPQARQYVRSSDHRQIYLSNSTQPRMMFVPPRVQSLSGLAGPS